jgi:lipopolysaccharide biosynthesis glycosyltransferase
LAGHLFGAVVNPLYSFMPNWPVEHLGVPSRSRYLNSGVLLLDLEQMRREGCVEAVRKFLATSPAQGGHVTHDQDALAALYHQRCRFLHPRWNVQTTYYELRLADIPVDRQQVLEARRHPAIVHFIGPWKPSHYVCRHPYRTAYLRHRATTPWPLDRPEGRNLKNFVLRHLPLQWVWRVIRLRDRLSRMLRPAPAAA